MQRSEKEDNDGTGYCRGCGTTIGEEHHSNCELMTLEVKIKENIWDHLHSFLTVYRKSREGNWNWYKNSKCKYVELRVDMRTGCCIIRDRDGNRIDPKDLEYQFEGEK